MTLQNASAPGACHPRRRCHCRGVSRSSTGTGSRDQRAATHDDRGRHLPVHPRGMGRYFIHDREKKEYYRMYIATLERLNCDGRACSWMEVGMTPEKDPAVVTRFLVEETRNGPGELLDVIVQVQGYSPFTVPKSFYEGEATDKEVGNFQGAAVVKTDCKAHHPDRRPCGQCLGRGSRRCKGRPHGCPGQRGGSPHRGHHGRKPAVRHVSLGLGRRGEVENRRNAGELLCVAHDADGRGADKIVTSDQ